MKSIYSITSRCLAIAACAACLHAPAQSATIVRNFSANATSYCQTALPVFDGNVRKRPLAVQNEGSSNAFVTCSFTAQATDANLVTLIANNIGASPASLTCTAVTGLNTGANEYVVKTVVVPASGWQGMQWTGADFNGSPAKIPGIGLFNVSCALPPGVGIGNSVIAFEEDIGA